MSWTETSLLYGVLLLACLAGGVGIGAAMGLVGIVGVTLASGTALWPTLADLVWNTTTNFNLVAIPLFVLMGELVLQGGVASRFYTGIAGLFRRVPGGLAQTNIAGCAIFSAIAGSSVTTAMTVGSVAIAEMRRRGYDDRLTLGTLTAGGCLGILIPPSIPLIVYSSMTQESVIDLFMAGLVPGLLLALVFSAFVAVKAWRQPGLLPGRGAAAAFALRPFLRDAFPIVLLISLIIASMYFGVVTPTEASGFGCLLAFLMACAYRQMTVQKLARALRNTLMTSAVIMFIVICAQLLNFAVVSSGIGHNLAEALTALDVPPFVFFLLLFAIYLVVGMFIDGLSIMLLTVPLLYPTCIAMGFDGVWLGILIVVFIELGALTPPMGLNLFAIQSIAPGRTLGDVAWSSAPYAALVAAFAFLLYFCPGIVLWLPAAMK